MAPVIITHLCFGRAGWIRRYGLLAIGLAGALPDALNPHLSLEARMTSWSHGLPFWGVLTTVVLLVSFLSKQRISWKLSCVLSLAYLFHIFCDAISGGVNFLYPVKDFNWGEYWVDPLYWIPLDIGCILTCYYLFRIKPSLEKKKIGN